MVNTSAAHDLTWVGALLRAYLLIAVGSVGLLAVLSVLASSLAPRDAWVHAIIVAVLALFLPLRLRAAQGGSRLALRAVGLIASVLVIANIVELLIPGWVPEWMKVQMGVVALLMAAVVALVIHRAVRTPE